MRKIYDVAQQEQVDESCDADIMSVKNQGKQQKYCIYDHIQSPETDGEHLMGATHERLEGVYAECGRFEKSNADGTDHDADDGHEDSFGLHKSTP
ncbi:MAG: hypothetical protein IIV62_00190 [Anaerotignum sp.]|nr:hypothetical protein [Anaerotignum sp.]